MEHCDPESDFDYAEDGDYLADPGVYEHILDVIDGLMDDVEDFLQDQKTSNEDQDTIGIRGKLRVTADSAWEKGKRYSTMLSNVQDIPKPQDTYGWEVVFHPILAVNLIPWKIDNSRDTPFTPTLANLYYGFGDPSDGIHPYEKQIKGLSIPEEIFTAPNVDINVMIDNSITW